MIGNCPHDWLFKHVSCVVHHGGAGTSAAGIYAGKPTVVVPFFGDQPFWGAMIARAGAGPEPVPYKDLTAEKLAGAITTALKPETADKARSLGEKIREEKGADLGGKSFHDQLDLKTIRCSLVPTRVAAWRVRRTKVILSPFAAETLVRERIIQYSDLKLWRPREYNTEGQPWDPISAVTSSLLMDIGELALAVADFPRGIFQSSKESKDTGSSSGSSHGRPGKSVDMSSGTLVTAPSTATTTAESVVPGYVELPSPFPGKLQPRVELPGDMPGLPSEQSGLRGAGSADFPAYATDISQLESASRPTTAGTGLREGHPSPTTPDRTASSLMTPLVTVTSDPTSESSAGQSSRSPLRFPSSPLLRGRSTSPYGRPQSSHDENPYRGVNIEDLRGASTSVRRIVTTGVKSPMNFCLGLAKGFRNVPKLYNDDTVRPTEKVTGLASGFKVAGKEFGLGLYDGLSGLVTQPMKGAEKEGGMGFVKGVGKGVSGFLVKPAAGKRLRLLCRSIWRDVAVLSAGVDYCYLYHC